MPEIYGNLTDKEICDLRVKCLEMFVTIGSKTGIEQDVVFNKARIAFAYAIEPLKSIERDLPQPFKPGPQSKRS